jgi:ABC-type molybdate transport system substrate-binding protein
MACEFTAGAAAETVRLHAASSLKAALGDVADAFERYHGVGVVGAFGASGLLRERIESGEPAQVFASANIKHPQALAEAGRAGPVALFAREPSLRTGPAGRRRHDGNTLLDVVLEGDGRPGTSTPMPDPSGDSAWEMFTRAESVSPARRRPSRRRRYSWRAVPTATSRPAGATPMAG